MVSVFKRILLGAPIATAEEGHQKLSKKVALPIFASDAVSSTAYATDEILIVLLGSAGIGALAFHELVPIAIIVAILLFIVVLSYRQTIHAYPSGGGAYIVSGVNLGPTPSLVAGASLLTDYILTVAVSIAGGVLAMQSGFGFSNGWRVPLCLVIIAIITVANLRGLRESGALFAPPTYLYILMLVLLIGTGFYRVFVQHVGPIPLQDLSEEAQFYASETKSLSIMMFLRAFSSGAVALSGVEAVSNGVPDFKKPAAVNASKTLAYMGADPRHLLPRRVDPGVTPPAVPGRERPDRHRPDGRVHLRRPQRPVLDHPDRHLPRAGARRQHRLRRVPAASARSSPRTATCPARWPTAATSWCSPTASSSSPSSPGC